MAQWHQHRQGRLPGGLDGLLYDDAAALGPEAPLIATGHGLDVLAVHLIEKDATEMASAIIAQVSGKNSSEVLSSGRSVLPSLIAGVAMAIGAMTVAMLGLPLASALLTSVFLGADTGALMPLVIVGVVVGCVLAARFAPEPAASIATSSA